MKSGFSQTRNRLEPADEKNIDRVCDRFEAVWQGDGQPQIEEYIADSAEPKYSALLHELVRIDVPYRRQHGESPSQEEYERRFPKHTAVIGCAFAEIEQTDKHDSATPWEQRSIREYIWLRRNHPRS